MHSRILLSLICLLSILVIISGCSDEPKGACIIGTGITAGCSPDLTENNCKGTMNGESWHEGKSCADLGFGGKSSASLVVISEIYLDATQAGLGWVELLNAGSQPIDLAGFTLVFGDSEGQSRELVLDGVIENCSTFVVGGPVSSPANGLPDFDMVASFDSEKTIEFFALFLPKEDRLSAQPLSAIGLGDGELAKLFLSGSTLGSPVGSRLPGSSIERLTWPAETWVCSSVPYPNLIPEVLGCNSSSGPSVAWNTINGIY
jgi:hypothetical protein